MSENIKTLYQGDPGVFGRTAVLLGGLSSEREISLKSGNAILDALKRQGVDAFAIDVQANVVQQLSEQSIDSVFIALHGPGGEDGKIQALLDLMGLPYTGSDFAASSVAMDKWKTKLVWNAQALPTPQSVMLTEGSRWSEVLAQLSGEAFVKPIHEGSSIGMSCVNSPEKLLEAYEKACEYDSAVMAETRVVGKEYTVAILNNQALPPIGLETDHVFYDFNAKYVSNNTTYLCPCGLSDGKTEELQALALKAFRSIACKGWGRVDIMMNAQQEFELLEVNTVPGMTDHSLVPMAAKQLGLPFDDLVLEILCQTLDA